MASLISQINGKEIYALTASYAINAPGSTSVINSSGTTLYSTIGSPPSGFSTSDSIFFGQNAGTDAINASYSNFLGNNAGYTASNAAYSNFLGYYAGAFATNAQLSNFIGLYAGAFSSGSSNSNFLGNQAGYIADNASYSNFLGNQAGYQAIAAAYSNFLGQYSGKEATNAYYSNFFGFSSGFQATNAYYSNFFGHQAGAFATSAQGSNFFGSSAGQGATNANNSNFLGGAAGQSATNASASNFLGTNAGYQATVASNSNFFGSSAGYQATNASNSNFLGQNAGNRAINASNSNFLGQNAGQSASFAPGSNFIGWKAGINAASASYSTFIGYQAGAGTGSITLKSNNIVIGTNITLPANTQDSINIGAIIFATGSYFNTSSVAPAYSGSQFGIGRVGINKVNPTYTFDVSGSGNYSNGLTVTGSVIVSGSDITTAWTSYTPVWTAASSNPVIGNGTITGQYKVIGKTCFVRGNIAMGSSTTFGSGEWYVSMPFTASHADAILMTANLLDNGTAWYNATINGARAGFNYKTAIQYQAVGGTANDVNATQPFTWANSDRFLWNGSFEIA